MKVITNAQGRHVFLKPDDKMIVRQSHTELYNEFGRLVIEPPLEEFVNIYLARPVEIDTGAWAVGWLVDDQCTACEGSGTTYDVTWKDANTISYKLPLMCYRCKGSGTFPK